MKTPQGHLALAHTNLTLSIESWVYVHHDDVFYFQDVNEVA
jgi:hypothetical protein